jgi:Co/Zn/Cd efflux system component
MIAFCLSHCVALLCFAFNPQSVAFCSFMTFTLCQTVAAFIAGSEAMMGDSAAMFVDALTYLFNLVAERKKNRFDVHDEQQQQQCHGVVLDQDQDPERAGGRRIRQRDKRKMTLYLELGPPLVSVTSLIIVTAFVLRKAIRVLILDIHRDVSKQGDPNVNLMLIFSSANLGLDFVNVFCFARAKHLMGYDTHIEETNTNYKNVDTTDSGILDRNGIHGGASSSSSQDEQHDHDHNGHGRSSSNNGTHENGDNATCTIQEHSNGVTPHLPDEKQTYDDEQEEKDGANLNMCSAYTVSLVLPLCCGLGWCSFAVAVVRTVLISCVVVFCCRSMSLPILCGVLQSLLLQLLQKSWMK